MFQGNFDCKEEILKDKEIADIVCVKCARMLRKKIRWFSYGQRFYFALGHLSGAWLYEGKDPGQEIGTGSILCSKDH